MEPTFGCGSNPITLLIIRHFVVVVVVAAVIVVVVLLLVVIVVGDPGQKSLKLCHFKSDRDEILQDYSSSKYASID